MRWCEKDDSECYRPECAAHGCMEKCGVCGGSGFSGRGTGYDDVCGECGGLKYLPRIVDTAADILLRAQAYVDRKYVARSDARQRSMGLAYVEAERVDLAREFARFAIDELTRLKHAAQVTTDVGTVQVTEGK